MCLCFTAQDNGSSRYQQQCLRPVVLHLSWQFFDLNEDVRNKRRKFLENLQMSRKGKKVLPMQARKSY